MFTLEDESRLSRIFKNHFKSKDYNLALGRTIIEDLNENMLTNKTKLNPKDLTFFDKMWGKIQRDIFPTSEEILELKKLHIEKFVEKLSVETEDEDFW